jgi:hypothetical protein
MTNDRDVVAEYVAASRAWHEASVNPAIHPGSQVAAARRYVRAIDAYISALRATGQWVPHRLEEVAAALRAKYGQGPDSPIGGRDTGRN